jgi:hypothetical protein
VFGMLSVLIVIPAFLVASPDVPSTVGGANGYYNQANWFVIANGQLPLLHILFGIVFVGALTSMLMRAVGPRAEIYITLIGGVIWLALTAAGLATEVAYPATVLRFGDMTAGHVDEPLLVLATWFYHYSQLGAAAMILSSSISIWRTGVLPKWACLLGILGIGPLLHIWIALPAAITTLVWIAVIGLVMLLAAKKTTPGAIELRTTQSEE